MESEILARAAPGIVLGAALLQAGDTTATQQVPVDPTLIPGAGRGIDPLNTVGLALLAYGLVQLLSKVVDKLPVWRGGDAAPATGAGGGAAAGFTAEDRKRLERVFEQAVADQQRLERLEDSVREQLAVHQRLIGQALDELREAHAKLDNLLRKLRALWTRVGRRRKDRG